MAQQKSKTLVVPNYLNFYETDKVNLCVENSFYSKILPSTAVSYTSPIEFFIPNINQCLISVHNTLLNVSFRVVDNEGKTTSAFVESSDQFYSVCNSTLSSLWSDVFCSINGQLVSNFNGNFAFLAHLDNFLSAATLKEAEFVTRLYKEDAASTVSSITESGSIFRSSFVNGSKICNLTGPLQIPLFSQAKLLPSNANLHIKLIPNKSNFVVMSKTTEYKIELMSVSLSVKYLKIDSNLLISSTQMMENVPYSCRYQNIIPKTLIIPSGVTSISLPNVIQGQLPSSLIFTLVSNSDYAGKISTSPLNFQNFNLSNFKITLNEKVFPSPQIDFSFKDSNYLELYYYSIKNAGLLERPANIDYKRFKDGYFFIANNLTFDEGNGFINPTQNGVLNIDLQFADKTTEIITLLVFASFPSKLLINKEGTVSIE